MVCINRIEVEFVFTADLRRSFPTIKFLETDLPFRSTIFIVLDRITASLAPELSEWIFHYSSPFSIGLMKYVHKKVRDMEVYFQEGFFLRGRDW